jgi:phosphoribosylanthranilate isomerase
MSTTVKICGVNSPEALAATFQAGADMIGFVFYEPSPRFIGLDTARQFARHCKERGVEIVALTVDAPDATLEAILRRVGPDYFQLHGNESPERVVEIQETYGVSVIKAIGVEEAADLGLAAAYAEADALLIDAKPPKGAVLPGGNGVAFDWAITRDFAPKKPWLLSGGLTPENVGEAIRASGARAVDVSSGVESAPGTKNPLRIAAFVAAARAAFTAAERE